MRLLRPLEQWRVEGESANWARPAESMCNLSSPTGPAGAGPAPSQPCACTCCPGGSGSGLARGQGQAGAGSPCSRTALPRPAGLLGASQSPQPAADHCSGHSGGGTRSLLTLLLLSRPPGLIVSVFCALCLSAVCSSEPRRTPWLWRWAVGCAPGLSPPPHPLRPVRAIG